MNPKLVIQLSTTPEGLSCATWYDDLGNSHGPGLGKGPFAALDDLYRRLGVGVGQLPRSSAAPKAYVSEPTGFAPVRRRMQIVDETSDQSFSKPEDEATKMARAALERSFGGVK